ncbi:MAG: FAD-binding oxidoreductase, partial [Dehalococcoidia bacterium]
RARLLVKASMTMADSNLVCGHDPWTVPIATVGGAISTHGLGYLGARYGSIGDQVLALEVVLADGTVIRTRPAERTSTGPQLRRLWVGAEGTLGVITEATLRVFPIPEARRLRALAFPSFASGYGAVCAMTAIGLRPAMIDFGGPPVGHVPARLQLAFEGYTEEVEAAEWRALTICADHGGIDLGDAAARDFFEERHVDPQRLRSWRRDEGVEPVPSTSGSAVFDYLHMYVPQSRVLEFFDRATAYFADAGADVGEWGLWNQPELVSLAVRRRTDTPAELERMRGAHDATLMLAQDLGGSMEYVHGVGARLAHLMEREHGAGLTVLRRIKRALDPEGLLNPGKLGM